VVQDTGVFTMTDCQEVVYAVSNGAIFGTIESTSKQFKRTLLLIILTQLNNIYKNKIMQTNKEYMYADTSNLTLIARITTTVYSLLCRD